MPRPLVTVSPRLAELERPAFRDAHVEYLEPSEHTEWNGDVSAGRPSGSPPSPATTWWASCWRCTASCTPPSSTRPGATYIGVDVNEVLAQAKGVCQDYAHLAVALCRSVGIPARYVSGYFFASSDATGADVDGDQVQVQTHAWFEAAIPDWGWLALDPTNAQQVGPAPHRHRPRPRLRRRAAGARRLLRRRPAEHRRRRRDPPPRARRPPGAGPAAAVDAAGARPNEGDAIHR